jgi:hypothetical protein
MAWSYVGYARRMDPAGCEAAARLVDEIARPFAGDRYFEHQCARAWENVGSRGIPALPPKLKFGGNKLLPTLPPKMQNGGNGAHQGDGNGH